MDFLQWAGGHFIFWKESFGPPRQSPLFTLNYLAINDETNGQYCQIGVLKYIFLTINAILIVSPVVVNCHIVPKATGIIFHSSHSNSLANPMKCSSQSMG